jgi:hypothetical protein
MKQRAVIVSAVFVVVVPLCIGMAWVLGFIPIGPEPALTDRTPVYEQTTATDRETLSFCLSKDYSGHLSLHRAHASQPLHTRLRNRSLHLIVDISDQGRHGSVVRVFKLNEAPLALSHTRAIQSCIPENGLPAAADPRNRAFYSGGD